MVILTGSTLTFQEVDRVVNHFEKVKIDEAAIKRVEANRKVVEEKIAAKQTMYGINTGFGKFSDVIIAEKDLADLQLNLIRSHACGVGEPFSEAISRTMMLLRANTLLRGYSGARVEVVEQLIRFINANIHPVIQEQGSLGESGDFAHLTHLTLELFR